MINKPLSVIRNILRIIVSQVGGIASDLDPTPDHSWSEWILNLLESGKYQEAQLPQIQDILKKYLDAQRLQKVTKPVDSFSSFEEVEEELQQLIDNRAESSSVEVPNGNEGGGGLQEAEDVPEGYGAYQTQVEVEFNPSPVGGKVTVPDKTYEDSMSAKDYQSNVWVRQSNSSSNGDRFLMVQFSSPMLYKDIDEPLFKEYYEKLYSTRKGYEKPYDFWELPQWVANLAYMEPKADFYTVRNMDEVKQFLNTGKYKEVLFSCLDTNKKHVKDLAESTDANIGIGGYIDFSFFKDNPNVRTYENLKDFAEKQNIEFKQGYDFRHFKGTKVVPRLNLSDGCSYNCAFCTIPRNIDETPEEAIQAQVNAFKDLNAQLIYINDKTFGQATNHVKLPDIYKELKSGIPDFLGFIVQTTATHTKKLGAEWLKNSGIKYIEIGVETYNDSILRKYRKPHNTRMIDEAVDVIRESGLWFIPNIIVGFPEETEETCMNTLNFLKRNSDIISHMNIFNLAMYEGTDLKNMIQTNFDDDSGIEDVVEKSFYVNKGLVRWFHTELMKLGLKLLDKEPYSNKTAKHRLGVMQRAKDEMSLMLYSYGRL